MWTQLREMSSKSRYTKDRRNAFWELVISYAVIIALLIFFFFILLTVGGCTQLVMREGESKYNTILDKKHFDQLIVISEPNGLQYVVITNYENNPENINVGYNPLTKTLSVGTGE